MPNHCANQLRITGQAADLAAFREFAKGTGPAWDGKAGEREDELDLNKFVPVPDSILNAKKPSNNGHEYDAFNSGGYDWVVNNWGTKWGCYDIQIEEEDDQTVTYQFQTAWAPFNDAVLIAMSERFPALKFELKYAEMGCGFMGLSEAEAGEITDKQQENTSGLAGDSEIQHLLSISG